MGKIKVSKTQEVAEYLGSHCGKSMVQCAEGKLVLVNTSIKDKIELLELPSLIQIEGNYTQPIIISETEDWYEGELCYTEKRGMIHMDVDTIPDEEPTGKASKILALPEHFTPEQLQDIVDEKMKDGDKVMVECEEILGDSGIVSLVIGDGDHIIKQPLILHKAEESWDDVRDRFYVENDAKIEEWSSEKRLLLEYHKWLQDSYCSPKRK